MESIKPEKKLPPRLNSNRERRNVHFSDQVAGGPISGLQSEPADDGNTALHLR